MILRNFKWCGGMKSLPDEHGRVYRFCEYPGSGKAGTWEQIEGDRLRTMVDSDTLEVDLGDPATLGALLGLVREVWGDANAFVDPRGGWHCCVSSKGPLHGHDLEFEGETEGEALLIALENA